uniref:Uncharacterized protein n=1 Tax=Setaria viridis TaxID=4556 RepID=A0A4U6TTW3_SETVI|nr:hypothetical protein SEVIR_7G093650v2 [Setaria viridis]
MFGLGLLNSEPKAQRVLAAHPRVPSPPKRREDASANSPSPRRSVQAPPSISLPNRRRCPYAFPSGTAAPTPLHLLGPATAPPASASAATSASTTASAPRLPRLAYIVLSSRLSAPQLQDPLLVHLFTG